jgi:LacI family transcriptional regulator
MPPTIRELARQLNLSIAAVSRALDGYPDISEATRQRVVQAAAAMGYVPNRAARQLRRRKADAIGYILPSDTPRFSAPFFSEFVAGLGDETVMHPFDLLISIAPPGEAAEQRIYQIWVQSHKVDGFILNQVHRQDWRVRYLAEQGVPFSALELTEDGVDYPRVEVDNRRGLTALVQHLVSRGFRRLAYIGGPETLVIQAERLAGFEAGLQAAGVPCPPEYLVSTDLTNAGGYQAAQRLRWLPDVNAK